MSVASLSLRGVFVGSGSDGMSNPRMAQIIVDLARQTCSPPFQVLYLSTATYDLPTFAQRRTRCYTDQETDSVVSALELVHQRPFPIKI